MRYDPNISSQGRTREQWPEIKTIFTFHKAFLLLAPKTELLSEREWKKKVKREQNASQKAHNICTFHSYHARTLFWIFNLSIFFFRSHVNRSFTHKSIFKESKKAIKRRLSILIIAHTPMSSKRENCVWICNFLVPVYDIKIFCVLFLANLSLINEILMSLASFAVLNNAKWPHPHYITFADNIVHDNISQV